MRLQRKDVCIFLKKKSEIKKFICQSKEDIKEQFGRKVVTM